METMEVRITDLLLVEDMTSTSPITQILKTALILTSHTLTMMEKKSMDKIVTYRLVDQLTAIMRELWSGKSSRLTFCDTD